jgi:hypothetical protein
VFAGYGLLQQGVLISPTDRGAALQGVLAEPPPGTHTWLTWLSMSDEDAARAASLAWALPTLAKVYRAHIDRLAERLAADPADGDDTQILRDYVDLLLPALTDTLREPALPAELLPPQLAGHRAQAGPRSDLGRIPPKVRALPALDRAFHRVRLKAVPYGSGERAGAGPGIPRPGPRNGLPAGAGPAAGRSSPSSAGYR